jgi:omega-hydroxy-beta-dihydromenaquinone-9 sulfotransferase
MYFRNRIKNFKHGKPPVFIIGHWRSGTTHLHNLLCQDPNHGFITTYQSVFVNNMVSKWIFKTFMNMRIPEHRPSDNVRLSSNFPQEDEFALANMTTYSFYHFFYFPSLNNALYDKYISFKNVDEKTLDLFQRKYRELLAKASINTGKDRLIVKNPVNTGKLKELLKMYPDAKFIFIYRNPVITYISTCRFFLTLLPSTALEHYDENLVKQIIIENYKKLIQDYLQSKHLIPQENLIEIRFEDFEQHNLDIIESIYKKLELNTWQESVPHFRNYITKQENYSKNKNRIRKEELEKVLYEWDFAMKTFGYDVPENLEVV